MKHFTNALYGKKLKFLRNQIDATQEGIAADLNMSQQAYGKLENGKTNFTEKRIREICTIFKIPFKEFVIVEDNFPQKILASDKTMHSPIINALNSHYEILFLESELRNVKLEQQLKNYKPYQEGFNEESLPIYVMI